MSIYVLYSCRGENIVFCFLEECLSHWYMLRHSWVSQVLFTVFWGVTEAIQVLNTNSWRYFIQIKLNFGTELIQFAIHCKNNQPQRRKNQNNTGFVQIKSCILFWSMDCAFIMLLQHIQQIILEAIKCFSLLKFCITRLTNFL